MKKIILFSFFVFLISCSGSDTYQGNWKAMNSDGEKFEIIFSPNRFSVKDSLGKSTEYNYTQNSYHYKNSIETYGINLEDGRKYQIFFPKKDQSVGLILDGNGNQMYTISRVNYITYEDIYKLD